MSARRTLLTLARRDVGRNRRRSVLTTIAVALGLALLIVINSLVRGVFADALHNTVLYDTGHVQLRAGSYDPDKLSLQAADLLAAPEDLAARATALPEVAGASPVLWIGGVVSSKDESATVRLVGIEPASAVADPYRGAVTAGAYLAEDDRNGVLVGRRLASFLGVGPGDNVSLALLDGDGRPVNGNFVVRGVFATGIPSYDEGSVLLPLSKAQGLAGVGDRASSVVLKLHDQADAAKVARELAAPGLQALTWDEISKTLTQSFNAGLAFYYILDLIVMLVVAVVIANTLLMAVFERVREMGILAALGMKPRQVFQMMLLEATILGAAGIALGLVLGLAFTAYLAKVGIAISESVAASAGNIAIGTTMYARFVPGITLALAFWTLVVILLAALYPARFAARLEPVAALHRN